MAEITEDIVIHPFARRYKDGRKSIDLKADFSSFSSGILQISMIPGVIPEVLLPAIENDKCKGVVLQSLGGSNVPNQDEYSFIKFIEYANSKNKPVIITNLFPSHYTLESHYALGVEAVSAGGIPTGNMTSAAAVVKFSWILAEVYKPRKISWARKR